MENSIVIVGAALLVGFIVWWFFGKRDNPEVGATMSSNKQEIEIVVNGGYVPNTVILKQGIPASVIFDRKDPSGCFNEVVFSDFGIHQTLPVDQKLAIDIDTSKPGEYSYACGMNMFHGKIIIK